MASAEEKIAWEREHIIPVKYTAIIQACAASLSFMASVAVACMVVLPKNGGLSTPYRRIIFGMSLSDILQNVGLIIGPWFIPSSDEDTYLKGVGNKGTCQFNGFIIILGVQAVPMYICLLCLYYLCRLKYKMADDTFYNLIERKAHFLIVVFVLVTAVSALATDTIHPMPTGNMCFVANTPRGCDLAPEIYGACDKRVQDIVDIMKWIDFAIPLMCFGIILVLMSLVCAHAIAFSSRAEQQGSTSSRSSNNRPRRVRREALASRAEQQSSISSRSSNDRLQSEGLASRAEQQGSISSSSGNDRLQSEGLASRAEQQGSTSSQSDNHNRLRSEGFARRTLLNEDVQSPLQSPRMHSINELDDLPEEPPLPPVFSTNDANPSTTDEDRTKIGYGVGVLARIYRNELILQAGLYIGVFCFTYGSILISMILLYSRIDQPKLFVGISLFCWSLGGALNIFVYSRPKIASLRRRYPECPWWKGFVLVLKAGGEVPDNLDLRCCKMCPYSKPEREVHRCPIGALDTGELAILTTLPRAGDMENISSAVGVNGRSLSFGESYQGVYNPEENWVRVEGRADVTREATSDFSYDLHVAQSGNERNISSLSEPLVTDLGSTVLSVISVASVDDVEDVDETSPTPSSIRSA